MKYSGQILLQKTWKFWNTVWGSYKVAVCRKQGKWEILCAQIGDGEVEVYGVIITSLVSWVFSRQCCQKK